MATLRTLRIRNLVIIEDVTVEFGPGLNLLTGETGAGKSVLVDALGLIAGARSDRTAVRTGEEKATVEALFEVPEGSDLLPWLAERGLETAEDGQILIRREIAAQGSGRVLLNGSPSTIGMLRELVERLLERHGQHEPRSLLLAERHLELLDRFGGHLRELEQVRAAHAAVRDAQRVCETLREQAGERETRLLELQETIRDIEEMNPREGELAELDRERRMVLNAGRVAELLDRIVSLTHDGDPTASGLAAAAATRAEELAEIDPTLEETARRLRSAATDLQDVGSAFAEYRERTEFDPARQEALEARRAQLERACLRYATDEAGLLERCAAAGVELERLQHLGDHLGQAEQALAAAEKDYVGRAAKLGRRRRSAARKLVGELSGQFQALSLGGAELNVGLEPAQGEQVGCGDTAVPLNAAGAERAEFMLAANPGEPLRPLRQVASGGELSRVMLALHVVVENEEEGRVLVFDEVDAGVGGSVADAVGARLKALSRTHQLLCVTHLPQVAAYADFHFRVRKRVEDGRTHAGIVNLSGNDRVEELARMLGGKRPNSTSRRHASALLDAAGRGRSATLQD